MNCLHVTFLHKICAIHNVFRLVPSMDISSTDNCSGVSCGLNKFLGLTFTPELRGLFTKITFHSVRKH